MKIDKATRKLTRKAGIGRLEKTLNKTTSALSKLRKSTDPLNIITELVTRLDTARAIAEDVRKEISIRVEEMQKGKTKTAKS